MRLYGRGRTAAMMEAGEERTARSPNRETKFDKQISQHVQDRGAGGMTSSSSRAICRKLTERKMLGGS